MIKITSSGGLEDWGTQVRCTYSDVIHSPEVGVHPEVRDGHLRAAIHQSRDNSSEQLVQAYIDRLPTLLNNLECLLGVGATMTHQKTKASAPSSTSSHTSK